MHIYSSFVFPILSLWRRVRCSVWQYFVNNMSKTCSKYSYAAVHTAVIGPSEKPKTNMTTDGENENTSKN